jgi:trehalose/maltose transport system permease protein
LSRRNDHPLILWATIVCIVFLSIGPFIWFALLAFKSRLEITAIPPAIIPRHVSLEAMSEAIFQYGLLHFFKNSVLVAGITTAVCVAVGTLAAYPLARLPIRFKRAILLLILAAGMFPQISIAGPVWRILRGLGWLNTYQGLILPYLALTLPITVWILSNFFSELPRELEEAAKIDGASLFQILSKVIVPLAAPGVFTGAILTFIYCWNEFFFALLIMTSSDFQTLPVGIALFPGEYTMPWGAIAAASIVTTMPLILLTVFFQKRIISGLTAGAVRG